MPISQNEVIKEYFLKNPNRDIAHPEIVDWAVSEYENKTGLKLRDPDRAIRKMAQDGFLVKVGKGIYRYDPDFVQNRQLEDFTLQQKEVIFKRDDYKCVQCGRGKNQGYELHADHIKAKDFGGKAEIENGQTLCSVCNFRKKNYGQTESGKKMFIRLHDLARKTNDKEMLAFIEEVLSTFEKHDINGHIEWKR